MRKARRPTLLLSALLLLPGALVTRAQDDLFFDTVDVRVVNVEVMVTDKDGNPVTGLTQDDFEIYEDGERVEITNFAAVERGETVLAGAEEGEAAAVPPGPVETQQLQLVLFVDNANILPQTRNLIFENLRGFVRERLGPRDRVMIVTHDDTTEVAQNFTGDPELLLATIDRLEETVGRHAEHEAQYRLLMTQMQRASLEDAPTATGVEARGVEATKFLAERFAQDVKVLAERTHAKATRTTATLERFTDSLAGMRGRKAILYVSDGFSTRPAEALSQAWLGKFEDWAIRNSETGVLMEITSLASSEYDAIQELEDLVEYASANRVAFYPISAANRMGGQGRLSAEVNDVSDNPASGGPFSLDVVNLERSSRESSLLQLADGTGGIAYTGSPNIGGLLERVARDFDTFYSLGYVPPGERDEEFHDIEVKVLPGAFDGKLQVRHLEGYREKDPLDHLQDLTLTALHYDLVDNPLGVRLDPGEPVLTGKKNVYRVPVMVKIPFEQILLLPRDEHHSARVTLYVVARDDRGGVSRFQRVELPIEIPNERILEAMSSVAAYPLELEMNPGAKRIAVGVRDKLARVDSTVHVDVFVGDGGEG